MKAIVLNGPNDFAWRDIENPTSAPDEVEIKVHLAGICGTDVTIVRGRNPMVPYPIVPGHESIGEVVKAPAVLGSVGAIELDQPAAEFLGDQGDVARVHL